MTNLRKAAEMVIEAHDEGYGKIAHDLLIQALRQALAQPEQKREWVEITYDEVYEFVCTTDSYINFARAIEAKLKERNT